MEKLISRLPIPSLQLADCLQKPDLGLRRCDRGER